MGFRIILSNKEAPFVNEMSNLIFQNCKMVVCVLKLVVQKCKIFVCGLVAYKFDDYPKMEKKLTLILRKR